jgi:hypothetical protein
MLLSDCIKIKFLFILQSLGCMIQEYSFVNKSYRYVYMSFAAQNFMECRR